MEEKYLSQKTKRDLEDLERYIKEFSFFLPLPICTLNPIGIIIDVNQSAKDLTGYNEIAIIGKGVDFLFEDKDAISRLLEEALKKRVIRNRNANLLTSKKKKIAVNVSVSVRKDAKGNIIGFFIAISDVSRLKGLQEGLETEVKERTKELEDSQKALMNMLEDIEEARRRAEGEKNKTLAIINNFADGLLVFDKENRVLLINPRAEGFLKIKKENFIGKSISDLSGNENLKPLTDVLGKKLEKISRRELRVGKELILEISIVSVKEREEKIGSLLILHDISREKLIEELKTEFVSLSAHQLRTPLSAIKWTLKMILEGDLGKINKEEKEFLEDAYKSNERMINLVNSLLSVSRIEEGRYIFNLVSTDIEKITKRVIASYEKEILNKKIKVEFKNPKKRLPEIMLDAEKIQIVIDNLIKNALKYTLRGGKIIISLAKNKKGEIEFSVEDNGVGIPKDQQKRIFTKFFRASNIRKIDTVGSGLGLYITKNIVEAHGGRIWFISKEGKGTTFSFTIPLKKPSFSSAGP